MDDLSRWLDTRGLGEIARLLREQEVDFETLLRFNHDNLRELGLKLGPRKRLELAIEDARNAAPEHPEPDLTRESGEPDRRQLTVLFCDLAGSTALSAQLDPEEYRVVIERFKSVCGHTVRAYEGRINQYLGDGALAYFGSPAHEDDAERAVRAALELTARLTAMDFPHGFSANVRIGIATGPVVLDQRLGSEASRHGAAVGETPNLAQRMQDLARLNEIVICEATHRLVGRAFVCEGDVARNVKGYEHPLNVWRVRHATEPASRFEALRSQRRTQFVGRATELAMLDQLWREASARRGQVVLVKGEAGVGKSRTVQAFETRLDKAAPVRVRWQCSPHHQSSALHPVIEQIRRAAGIGNRNEDARQHLAELTEALLAADPWITADVPLIARLIGLPEEVLPPAPAMSREEQKESTLRALVRIFAGLTEEHPALLVVEDAQWLDASSEELLKRLVRRSAALAILVVVTVRDPYDRRPFEPSWQTHPHASTLTLERLVDDDVVRMIEGLRGPREIPEEVIDEIVAKTDGNPLFVEEFTKAVLEGDAAGSSRGESEARVPSSLAGSLRERLDRLAAEHPKVKRIVQTAAAIGREFDYRVLGGVLPIDEQELTAVIDTLVAANLFKRRARAPDSLSFNHALLRDEAYRSLLFSQRRLLHADIADVLRRRHPEQRRTQPELLARHYQLAGHYDEAVQLWRDSGTRAVGLAANEEAAGHLLSGLELFKELRHEGDWTTYELGMRLEAGDALRAARGSSAPPRPGSNIARPRPSRNAWVTVTDSRMRSTAKPRLAFRLRTSPRPRTARPPSCMWARPTITTTRSRSVTRLRASAASAWAGSTKPAPTSTRRSSEITSARAAVTSPTHSSRLPREPISPGHCSCWDIKISRAGVARTHSQCPNPAHHFHVH